MKFLNALNLLTYATVLWSFLTLVSTGEIHLPVTIAFLVIFILAVLRSRTRFQLPKIVWTVISLAVLAAAAYGWFAMGQRMYSVTYLLLYLECNKLLTAEKNRDYMQLFGLTFFQILAAAVSTTSVVFALQLAVYMFLIIGAMIFLTIRRDAEKTFEVRGPSLSEELLGVPQPQRSRRGDRPALRSLAVHPFLDRRIAVWLAFCSVFVLLLGSTFFWMIPRASQQNFFPGLAGMSGGSRTSGFADHIQFGGVGEIQQDPTIVMRAAPYLSDSDERPSFIRIRGSALDFFNGREWTRSEPLRDATLNTIEMLGASQQQGKLMHAQITLEPDSSGYIFTVDQPVSVEFDKRTQVLMNQDLKTARFTRPPYMTMKYDVYGRIESPDVDVQAKFDKRIQAGQTPSLVDASRHVLSRIHDESPRLARQLLFGTTKNQQTNPSLSLPTGIADSAIVRQLARDWTEGMQTPEDKAREIERHFRTEYDYSLDVSFSSRPDHLRYFLLIERRGHCEYFATSMVLMLRHLGIAARVVNGYLTDEWNRSAGGYYVVRQEHAHSWVEAQIGRNNEWTTFDPTPATGVGSNRIQPSIYHAFSRALDSVKMAWYNAVIDYDLKNQQQAMMGFLRFLHRTSSDASDGMQSLNKWWSGDKSGLSGRRLIGIVLIFSAVAAALGLYLWYRHRESMPAGDQKTTSQKPPFEAVKPYLELMKEMQAIMPRPAGQTPLAFARRVAHREIEPLPEFLPLTQAYYEVRFNGAPWTGELDTLVESLRGRLAEIGPPRDSKAARKMDSKTIRRSDSKSVRKS